MKTYEEIVEKHEAEMRMWREKGYDTTDAYLSTGRRGLGSFSTAKPAMHAHRDSRDIVGSPWRAQ